MFTSEYFDLGMVVCSPAINAAWSRKMKFRKDIKSAMEKYIIKDWGNVSETKKHGNEESLKSEDVLYILGTYDTCDGKINISTKKRIAGNVMDSVTTICFCDERQGKSEMGKPTNTVFGLWDRIEDTIYSKGRTKKDVAIQCGFDRKLMFSHGNLSLVYFARLCSALNVSADYLLFGGEK